MTTEEDKILVVENIYLYVKSPLAGVVLKTRKAVRTKRS